MASGNIEGYYQVVPENIVKKVVGSEAVQDYGVKLEALKASGTDICDSAVHDELDDNGYGTINPESKEWLDFKKAYDKVCDTFKEKTGLGLYALYTEGDGDCYDDLESGKWYWVIPDQDVWVRKTTPKADEFMKKYGNTAIDADQRFSRYG